MSYFIFRHFSHFHAIQSKNEEEAKLLFFVKRRRDFYYYKLVANFKSLREVKKYIRENRKKPYIELKN